MIAGRQTDASKRHGIRSERTWRAYALLTLMLCLPGCVHREIDTLSQDTTLPRRDGTIVAGECCAAADPSAHGCAVRRPLNSEGTQLAPPAGDASETNGNVYYVITQGAGMGDGVYRFPITGNVTVRDALSRINGLDDVSSKKIWIARADRNQEGANQILPVDGVAIEKNAASEMNYQVIPGDRIFIAEDKLVGYGPAKIISPFERIMGFAMPGTDTVTRFSGKELRGGGNSRNSF